MPNQLAIRSVGTALPAHSMSQVQAAELARQVLCETDEQASLVNAIYRKAGVQNRYTVLPFERALEWRGAGPTTAERMAVYRREAPDLAQRAADAALTRARIGAEQITHLVTVSCTGFHAPGIDLELTHALGLRPTVERVHVGFMGCHGVINGLRVAQAIVESKPAARVLLCAVELCSLHYQYRWSPEHIVGNAIFGDGAAALVGAASEDQQDWRIADTASCLLPESEDAMSWSIGDHGFLMQLSPRVPDIIRAGLRPWLESWLADQGLALADVRTWAVHPGGPRILLAVEAALSLPDNVTQVSRDVLREYGNLSSPTVLFILKRLIEQQAPRPCVLLGFGPGLAAETALVV